MKVIKEEFDAVLREYLNGLDVSDAVAQAHPKWSDGKIVNWYSEYREAIEAAANLVIREKRKIKRNAIISEILKREKIVSESQSQGTIERVARKVRIPNVIPSKKKIDKTPKKPANNDPTKTARGKRAVQKRVNYNKDHPEKFEEIRKTCIILGADDEIADAFIEEFYEIPSRNPDYSKLNIDNIYIKMFKSDYDGINKLACELNNPIGAHRILSEINHPKAKIINDVIKNVWHDKPFSIYVGIGKGLKQELNLFDLANDLRESIKEYGYKFAWTERIEKPGCALYKVCVDKIPSNLYSEHKELKDRYLILSNDRSNIIQIVHGD